MSSLWPWIRLPFYLASATVSLGGGALYYFQKCDHVRAFRLFILLTVLQ